MPPTSPLIPPRVPWRPGDSDLRIQNSVQIRETSMSVEYVSVEEAIQREGLRMVVVGGVPSLWGEAAKGILYVKQLEWVAVRLVYDSDALKSWAGQRSGPVLVFNDEAPLSNWKEILMLAERLAPTPALLPADERQRALVLDLSRDICGEGGLGWTRRLQLVHSGMQGGSGFPERVAKYLSAKYGYSAEAGEAYSTRVASLLDGLVSRLKTQRDAGSRYYVGSGLTAADIYSATAVAMFGALPAPQCEMDPVMRTAFDTRDASTTAALDPVLFEHRDMIYAQHLELPLSL
jgi:glutathione S-transferase